MLLIIPSSARHALRIQSLRYLRKPSWAGPGYYQTSQAPRRCFHEGGRNRAVEEAAAEEGRPGFWGEYKRSFNIPRPNFEPGKQVPLNLIGKEVTAVGFLGKRKNFGSNICFSTLFGPDGEKIQLLARSEDNEEANRALRTIPQESAVSVTGILHLKHDAKNPKISSEKAEEGMAFTTQVEIRLQNVTCINAFPKNIHVNTNTAKHRHLQIRFDPTLKERLQFRSKVAAFARRELADFTEIETPILFKSTPEGAREFIVPTRRRGYAYSLPQSPQQYKQILMASGIHKYVQFARCFRDEDHRADRQPEFTQIDLEMAWADGEDVMQRVEKFMKALWQEFMGLSNIPTFRRMGYHEAMSKYGSDKPDLRIPGLIHRIDHILPASLRGMLTSIENPIVEAWKVRLDSGSKISKKFVTGFMDSAEAAEFRNNPDGAPGVFIFDPRKPLEGLHAFGFEAAEQLQALYADAAASPEATDSQFEEGDVLFIQARENVPHTGGSTMLGRLRLAFFNAARSEGQVTGDLRDQFLWVTDFPMFTLNDGDGPGQEGHSGFSATHHPFTAPKSAADVDLLLTDPLSAIADHYDLVLNGVELGGGSRRIHSAEMQQFIMRDILKMEPKRMDSFSHLFEALRAGCPPHAGLAIGFDRLIAVMSRRESVRDVIAFPKDKLGNDLLVNSPSRLTSRQLFDYHIKIRSEKEVNEENEARDKIFNLGVNRLLETLKGVQWMKASDNLLYPVSKDNENPDRPCHAEEISRVLNQLDSKVKDLRPQGAEITAEDLDWRTEYPAEVKRTKQVLEQMDSLMEKLEHIKEGCIASVETRTELKEILSFVEFLELRFQILQKWPYPELLSDIENVIRDVSRILTGDE